ncbi:hypothetical protein BDZ91DRAFT_711746 [Kalaharituber pfeilii]|nr:hypothetical protein BDZ91DRAFT_711746 [Kalaharituber pfeilii]
MSPMEHQQSTLHNSIPAASSSSALTRTPLPYMQEQYRISEILVYSHVDLKWASVWRQEPGYPPVEIQLSNAPGILTLFIGYPYVPGVKVAIADVHITGWDYDDIRSESTVQLRLWTHISNPNRIKSQDAKLEHAVKNILHGLDWATKEGLDKMEVADILLVGPGNRLEEHAKAVTSSKGRRLQDIYRPLRNCDNNPGTSSNSNEGVSKQAPQSQYGISIPLEPTAASRPAAQVITPKKQQVLQQVHQPVLQDKPMHQSTAKPLQTPPAFSTNTPIDHTEQYRRGPKYHSFQSACGDCGKRFNSGKQRQKHRVETGHSLVCTTCGEGSDWENAFDLYEHYNKTGHNTRINRSVQEKNRIDILSCYNRVQQPNTKPARHVSSTSQYAHENKRERSEDEPAERSPKRTKKEASKSAGSSARLAIRIEDGNDDSEVERPAEEKWKSKAKHMSGQQKVDENGACTKDKSRKKKDSVSIPEPESKPDSEFESDPEPKRVKNRKKRKEKGKEINKGMEHDVGMQEIMLPSDKRKKKKSKKATKPGPSEAVNPLLSPSFISTTKIRKKIDKISKKKETHLSSQHQRSPSVCSVSSSSSSPSASSSSTSCFLIPSTPSTNHLQSPSIHTSADFKRLQELAVFKKNLLIKKREIELQMQQTFLEEAKLKANIYKRKIESGQAAVAAKEMPAGKKERRKSGVGMEPKTADGEGKGAEHAEIDCDALSVKKRRSSERAIAKRKESSGVDNGSKTMRVTTGLSIICSACGSLGHNRKNLLCPARK